jgi:DNA adenine methylase
VTRARQTTLWAEASGFRPLVKWPGGKAREWSEIEPYLPARIRHLADPFMGGLAPFALTPFEGRALLNDRHRRLVDLHVRVQRQDADLLSALVRHGAVWHELAAAAADVFPAFAHAVDRARAGNRPDRDRLETAATPALTDLDLGEDTLGFVVHSLADKAWRLARLETKHDVRFDGDELGVHGETALRAGYYTRVRERERTGEGAQAAADFWFVREYCYGAMFRLNARGEFNIPYGGASYNRKSFLDRREQATSRVTREALERATFTCGDFEEFLDGAAADLGPDDFVFVDPPYHSAA